MIDYHTQVRDGLNTILPTYYEMALRSGLAVPCLSYMETNNYEHKQGNTIGYSYITYQVKIWANDIETIQNYIWQVDNVMRALGFKRVSSGELYDMNSTMIQKILTYEALALEDY